VGFWIDANTFYSNWKVMPSKHLTEYNMLRGNVWGAVHKNIISDRFSTKTAISAHI